MNSLFILITAAALGIEVGWDPLAEGGHEYTIQIEPSIVGMLEHGNDLVSEVLRQSACVASESRSAPARLCASMVQRQDPKQPVDTPPGDSIDRAIAAPSKTRGGADASPPQSKSSNGPNVPAKFSDQAAGAEPLDVQPSGFDEPAKLDNTEKPRLDSATPGENRGRRLIALVLLGCSLRPFISVGSPGTHGPATVRPCRASHCCPGLSRRQQPSARKALRPICMGTSVAMVPARQSGQRLRRASTRGSRTDRSRFAGWPRRNARAGPSTARPG